MLLKWQKLASDVTQVGHISTLKIGRKAYLLDYFLKEGEIWSFFNFTKAHSGRTHGVLLAAQLHSLHCHGCWLPVILSRLGCHPDTGNAESVHPLEACTVAWCRLKETHISAAPLARLNVPLLWQLAVLMPISVTRQFKWGRKPIYSRQPNCVGNNSWLRWCPYLLKRAVPRALVLHFSSCMQKLFLKHFSMLYAVCTNVSK